MLGLVYRGGEVGWRGWVERRCRESEKRGSKKENFCDLILEGKVIWRENIWREKEGESIKKVFGEEGYERDRERLRKGPQMAELDACVACPRWFATKITSHTGLRLLGIWGVGEGCERGERYGESGGDGDTGIVLGRVVRG